MGLLSMLSSLYFLFIPISNIESEEENYYTSLSPPRVKEKKHSFKKDI